MASKRLEIKLRKLFNIPKKGETFEFRKGLVSQYAEERKDTIQRVISAMTVGKDVSSLFPDVLKNIATHDLEQKKLVYLYLMNYAKTNPELCILAVNTFVQDTEDPNPLVRALAIRTMGCIRVDKMVDYMEIPLKRTLQDTNPYVRKTAAICVAKLYEMSPSMVMETELFEMLSELISDSNQMVVANAIAALIEIQNSSNQRQLFKVSSTICKKLLVTLSECTEWGRISILGALADYKCEDVSEANHIIQRVLPQLQHENPAVVLNAIKVLLNNLENVDEEQRQTLIKRLTSPLVSLLSSPPEIQYLAIRNIRIISEKYPTILSNESRIFFIKYKDPLYLKLEKIEILVRLANEENGMLLLAELREYSMEIEPEICKRAIHGIGQIAIKLSKISKKSIDVLYELFLNRSDFVINQIVVVLQNILRKYPNEYLTNILTIIGDLNLENLNTSEGLSSYIWIIGEYPKDIPYLEDKLTVLVNQFIEMEPQVQLSLLTSIVKINFNKPSSIISKLLQDILNQATTKIQNVDVRDKAYIYWRILSTDNVELQKQVILSKLPILESTIEKFSPILLNELLKEISNLGSIYYKPSSFFDSNDSKLVNGNNELQSKKIEELQQIAKNEIVNNTMNSENLLDFDDDDDGSSSNNNSPITTNDVLVSNNNILDELSDLFSGFPAPSQESSVSPLPAQKQNQQQQQQSSSSALFDILGESTSSGNSPSTGKKSNNEDLLNLF